MAAGTALTMVMVKNTVPVTNVTGFYVVSRNMRKNVKLTASIVIRLVRGKSAQSGFGENDIILFFLMLTWVGNICIIGSNQLRRTGK